MATSVNNVKYIYIYIYIYEYYYYTSMVKVLKEHTKSPKRIKVTKTVYLMVYKMQGNNMYFI